MKKLYCLTMLIAATGLIMAGCEKLGNPVETPLAGQSGLVNVSKVEVATVTGTQNYGDVTLSGGFQTGHFADVWDLTAGDMTISFTYDGTGMVDDAGAHAWAELGVRSLGSKGVDFNPFWRYTSAEESVDLMAGQHNDVGDVLVWGDGTNLYVTYTVSEAGCAITETHLAVATSLSDIPQTKKGNPIPGQFPYSMIHNPPVTEYTYTLDATQWDAAAELFVAAHAVVVCGGNEESAWAAGNDFGGKNWATYFNYTYNPVKEAGSGVWLATDYEWKVGTFDPDPMGAPTLDLDDKLILQKQGGIGESAYDLPEPPPVAGNNHRFWWDRDGVDPWQNPATANTGGLYQIVITLHATSATAGTAYMNIRGLDQGFETDGNWSTIELTPAGITFAGDMEHLQVFYGIYGYDGATHSASFKDIIVSQ